MKDNTVTIHPTVKSSTLYALELLQQERKTSLGRILEECLTKCSDYTKKKELYKKS